MLDVEQPPGVRARVLDRLGKPERRVRWKLLWAAVPIAAAAILFLALRVTREVPAPRLPDTFVVALPKQPSLSVAPSETSHVPRPQPARTARRPVTERVVAAAVAAEDTEFAVPALAGPESLTVRPLAQPAAQQLPPTGPEPMQIRALEVSALPETPRERREE